MAGFIGFGIGFIAGILISAVSYCSRGLDRAEWNLQTDALKPHYGYFQCSNCGTYSEGQSLFCPKCGKYMR